MAKKPRSISQEDWDEPYAPVLCDPQAELLNDLKDAAFKEAYNAVKEEYGVWGAMERRTDLVRNFTLLF